MAENKKSDYTNYKGHNITSAAQGCGYGSGVFAWIRIRIRFSNFSGSGSCFQISLDPDPVSAQILEQKKSAERSLKVIYQKKI